MDPDRPAPGSLELVRHVLNSDDRFHGVDHSADLGTLNRYLALFDGAHKVSNTRELAGYRALREAVRTFLLVPGPDSARGLNQIGGNCPLVVVVDGQGRTSLQAAADRSRTALDLLSTAVIAATHDAQLRGQWDRLHICQRDDCAWVYYDSTRNNSGRWCTTDPCGNVMKTRAYRARKQRATSSRG